MDGWVRNITWWGEWHSSEQNLRYAIVCNEDDFKRFTLPAVVFLNSIIKFISRVWLPHSVSYLVSSIFMLPWNKCISVATLLCHCSTIFYSCLPVRLPPEISSHAFSDIFAFNRSSSFSIFIGGLLNILQRIKFIVVCAVDRVTEMRDCSTHFITLREGKFNRGVHCSSTAQVWCLQLHKSATMQNWAKWRYHLILEFIYCETEGGA